MGNLHERANRRGAKLALIARFSGGVALKDEKAPALKIGIMGVSALAAGLSLIISLPAFSGANVENPEEGRISRVGAKLGFNLTNQIYSEEDELVGDKSFGFGMVLGGFVTFIVNRDWAVQPEFLYVKKGAEYSFGRVSFKSSYDYLEIPVLAKYTIRVNEKFTPNVYAGPAAGFLVTARWKGESSSMDIGGRSNPAEVGLAVGADWTANIEGHNVMVDIRYTRGLSRVNFALTGEPEPGAIYNSTIGFTAGYLF